MGEDVLNRLKRGEYMGELFRVLPIKFRLNYWRYRFTPPQTPTPLRSQAR
jgi:hypothetical protein